MLVASFPFFSIAQKPHELDYIIQFAGTLDPTGSKGVFSVLNDVAPTAQVSLDRELARAKVRTTEILSGSELEDAFAEFGLVIEFIVVANEGHPGERVALDLFNSGFPQFVDTGNPELDAASYAVAKEAWIIAHPVLYQQLLQGQTSGLVPQTE